MPMIELSELEESRGKIELAIYGDLDSEARRAFAQNASKANCGLATDRALRVLGEMTTFQARREVHSFQGFGHHFVSVPVDEGEIGADDLVIDPTYLQYSLRSSDTSPYPELFIGKRSDVIKVMDSGDFRNPIGSAMYKWETWLPAKN